MGAQTLNMMPIAASVALAILGVWLMVVSRRATRPTWLALPGVGELSPVTLTVTGLASLLLAYHLFMYAARFDQFRAPLWIVLVVSLLAGGLSLLNDALERLGDQNADRRDDGSDGDGSPGL